MSSGKAQTPEHKRERGLARFDAWLNKTDVERIDALRYRWDHCSKRSFLERALDILEREENISKP